MLTCAVRTIWVSTIYPSQYFLSVRTCITKSLFHVFHLFCGCAAWLRHFCTASHTVLLKLYCRSFACRISAAKLLSELPLLTTVLTFQVVLEQFAIVFLVLLAAAYASIIHHGTVAACISLHWSCECQCVDDCCNEEGLEDVALSLHFTLCSACCKSQMMSWKFLLSLSCYQLWNRCCPTAVP